MESPSKKCHYLEIRRVTQGKLASRQGKLRDMKNKWWDKMACELQEAADQHDMKRFYKNLRSVHGSKVSGFAPVKNSGGMTLLTTQEAVLQRWADHFNLVLNQPSSFDSSVITELPQSPIFSSLDASPTLVEVQKAIKALKAGKAPGCDGIPPEVFKYGGNEVASQLQKFFALCWHEGKIPQDFKNSSIVHLYKHKGDRSLCDNHRGISLLSVAGKIMARVLLQRLSEHVDGIGLLPESQCGFRAGRGTADMIFSVRQL